MDGKWASNNQMNQLVKGLINVPKYPLDMEVEEKNKERNQFYHVNIPT